MSGVGAEGGLFLERALFPATNVVLPRQGQVLFSLAAASSGISSTH